MLPPALPPWRGFNRFEDHRSAEQVRRGRSDDHLTVLARLLELPGLRHHRSGDHVVNGGPGTCHDDVAGLDAGPQSVADALHPRCILVQGVHRCARLERGPRRPLRVVFVRDREPEERHQRVPEQPLHAPAVALEDAGGDARGPRPHPPDRLRIHPRLRRRCQVHGEDRDRPAFAREPR